MAASEREVEEREVFVARDDDVCCRVPELLQKEQGLPCFFGRRRMT